MLEDKHLQKLKKFIKVGGKSLDLTKTLLCTIALGEKLPPELYSKRQATQAWNGLRRHRFVRRTKSNSYSLTPKGRAKLEDMIIDEIQIKNLHKWDGRWRLVMYDLPIRFKKAREAFRWKLKDLGFFQFQKSAWAYPYPCATEILFVADFYGVRRYIEILEVGKILDDRKLKAHFNL